MCVDVRGVMKKKNIFLYVTVFILSVISAVAADERSEIKISEILFSQTSKWQAVSTFPQVDNNWFDKEKKNLENLLLKFYPDETSCSFFTSYLEKKKETKNIFHLDINQDNIKDLIVTGYAPCREGYFSLIWLGSKTSISNEKPIVLYQKVLKILPQSEPKISSVKIGCCGYPINIYSVGFLENPWRLGSYRVAKNLEYPQKININAKDFSSKKNWF